MEALAQSLSVEEYLALDRLSEERWEFICGEVIPYSVMSPRRNAVVMNVLVKVALALKGKPAFAMPSSQQIECGGGIAYFYPALSVICGKPRLGLKNRETIANPTVLIEVLSESTGDYDRARKFDHYSTIPEFQEYLVVSSEERRVDHWKRTAENQWLVTRITTGEVHLESIDITLTLDEVYADLERVEP